MILVNKERVVCPDNSQHWAYSRILAPRIKLFWNFGLKGQDEFLVTLWLEYYLSNQLKKKKQFSISAL